MLTSKHAPGDLLPIAVRGQHGRALPRLLPGKQAQRVVWVLQLIEDLDAVPAQYLKKLPGTDDLWEARVQVAGAAFRLLGFMEGDRFVLVHGFEKKTEKTPAREIETATRRKKDHIERKGKP